MAVTFTPLAYKAVGTAALNTSSFKNPRHKMWGVFCKYPGSSSASNLDKAWKLTLQTNDIQEVKLYVNTYLKNPPTFPAFSGFDANDFVGIDAVMAVEILPIDSFTKL